MALREMAEWREWEKKLKAGVRGQGSEIRDQKQPGG
jgi:hypothetical protein